MQKAKLSSVIINEFEINDIKQPKLIKNINIVVNKYSNIIVKKYNLRLNDVLGMSMSFEACEAHFFISLFYPTAGQRPPLDLK